MASIPFATQWDEIIPGLFQGGHDWTDPSGRHHWVIVDQEFDVVFSLYQRDGCGPGDGIEHHYLDIPDGALTPTALRDLRALADQSAAAVRVERYVLHRCQAGYNRSGLLTALVLLRLGWTADDAIAHIRNRRSPWALCNQHFLRYIHDEAKAMMS